MTRDLEERLRAALAAADPGEKFTQGVLARLPGRATAPRRTPRRWPSLALAASLAAALLAGVLWHEQRAQRGLEARRELIEALRVSSRKLDLAYRMVKSPPPQGGADQS